VFNLRDALVGGMIYDHVVSRGTPRPGGTALITEALAERASWDGLCVEREVVVKLPASMQSLSGHGRWDLLIRLPEDSSGMVIEIDSSAKVWSMDKLLYAREELGYEALWVRWHDQRQRYVPPSVRLLDLCTIEDIHRAEGEEAGRC
jgi:hypothetical protein